MNYRILWDKNRAQLEQKVIDALKDGWELQGGGSISGVTSSDQDGSERHSLVWCQAVVKTK